MAQGRDSKYPSLLDMSMEVAAAIFQSNSDWSWQFAMLCDSSFDPPCCHPAGAAADSPAVEDPFNRLVCHAAQIRETRIEQWHNAFPRSWLLLFWPPLD